VVRGRCEALASGTGTGRGWLATQALLEERGPGPGPTVLGPGTLAAVRSSTGSGRTGCRAERSTHGAGKRTQGAAQPWPTLAVTTTCSPPAMGQSATAHRLGAAAGRAPAGLSTFGHGPRQEERKNSSARRGGHGVAGAHCRTRSRWPPRRRRSSPTAGPAESLTTWNRSRSRTAHRLRKPGRRRDRGQGGPRRSIEEAAVASPVQRIRGGRGLEDARRDKRGRSEREGQGATEGSPPVLRPARGGRGTPGGARTSVLRTGRKPGKAVTDFGAVPWTAGGEPAGRPRAA